MNIQAVSELNLGAILAACFGLLVFGALYNALYELAESRGYVEGNTWAFVAGGVGAVLVVAGLLFGWTVAVAMFFLFASAGAPMGLGEIARYVGRREAGKRALVEATEGSQHGAGMAE